MVTGSQRLHLSPCPGSPQSRAPRPRPALPPPPKTPAASWPPPAPRPPAAPTAVIGPTSPPGARTTTSTPSPPPPRPPASRLRWWLQALGVGRPQRRRHRSQARGAGRDSEALQDGPGGRGTAGGHSIWLEPGDVPCEGCEGLERGFWHRGGPAL